MIIHCIHQMSATQVTKVIIMVSSILPFHSSISLVIHQPTLVSYLTYLPIGSLVSSHLPLTYHPYHVTFWVSLNMCFSTTMLPACLLLLVLESISHPPTLTVIFIMFILGTVFISHYQVIITSSWEYFYMCNRPTIMVYFQCNTNLLYRHHC